LANRREKVVPVVDIGNLEAETFVAKGVSHQPHVGGIILQVNNSQRGIHGRLNLAGQA
jgi:hypothetical protein